MKKYIARQVIKYINENEQAKDEDIYIYLHNKIERLNSRGQNVNIFFVEDSETRYWSRPVSETLSDLQGLGLIYKLKRNPITYQLTPKGQSIFFPNR